jgi:hypothetical protein
LIRSIGFSFEALKSGWQILESAHVGATDGLVAATISSPPATASGPARALIAEGPGYMAKPFIEGDLLRFMRTALANSGETSISNFSGQRNKFGDQYRQQAATASASLPGWLPHRGAIRHRKGVWLSVGSQVKRGRQI